jgi:hypothetical protein
VLDAAERKGLDQQLTSPIAWLSWTTSHMKTPGGADGWETNKGGYATSVNVRSSQ